MAHSINAVRPTCKTLTGKRSAISRQLLAKLRRVPNANGDMVSRPLPAALGLGDFHDLPFHGRQPFNKKIGFKLTWPLTWRGFAVIIQAMHHPMTRALVFACSVLLML